MSNIIFVMYHNFKSNSAIQVHNFANALTASGNKCIVAVPNEKETLYTDLCKKANYNPLTFKELNNNNNPFSNFGQPDIIHAWTPRENVRKEALYLKEKFKSAKMIIHLEDNDCFILEKNIGMSLSDMKKLSADYIDKLIGEESVHPLKYEEFIKQCDGVTVIIDRLLEFVPKGKESMVLWPILDEERFFPRNKSTEVKNMLGITEGEIILCYTGNVHSANAEEIRSLYVSVALANREGVKVKLLRTGNDYCDFLGPESQVGSITKNIIKLGFVPHEKIPEYLALSDILIQPGKPDQFNEYRLPSKIPEFLGMGIPIALPYSNLGKILIDMRDAIILHRGDSLEILDIIKNYNKMSKEYKKIGEKGLEFAKKNFDKKNITSKLVQFYTKIISSKTDAVLPTAIISKKDNEILKRYSSFQTQEIAYSTVRDFCDSLEHLRNFCNLDGDLKNSQRPWIIKAILSKIKPGGKILEIGAGTPVVANFLASLGYDVTVIDPYDGNGNGPKEYEYIKKQYPNINIVRKYFSDNLTDFTEESFDCVYSISVLEHVPNDDITAVFNGIKKYLRPDGYNIHCIDNVLLGKGKEFHYENLRRIFKELRIEDKLDDLLRKLKDDVETYFLSAEGHLLWKGDMSYDEFPFRRVVSINLCKTDKK